MAEIEAVCVYCGSSPGQKPVYADAARALGNTLADNGIRLVYGGGSVGLMGITARTVIERGGHVTGIIPKFLADREVMLRDAQDLVLTEDMHERKRTMFDRSDAFIALPGGIGTLEELVEMMTWAQLGRHRKPILVANVDGFWDPFVDLLDHMIDQQFVTKRFVETIAIVSSIDEIVPRLKQLAADLPDDALDQVAADSAPLSNL